MKKERFSAVLDRVVIPEGPAARAAFDSLEALQKAYPEVFGALVSDAAFRGMKPDEHLAKIARPYVAARVPAVPSSPPSSPPSEGDAT
jgi:hypothetical protein